MTIRTADQGVYACLPEVVGAAARGAAEAAAAASERVALLENEVHYGRWGLEDVAAPRLFRASRVELSLTPNGESGYPRC